MDRLSRFDSEPSHLDLRERSASDPGSSEPQIQPGPTQATGAQE